MLSVDSLGVAFLLLLLSLGFFNFCLIILCKTNQSNILTTKFCLK